jgi:hypothetical protein
MGSDNLNMDSGSVKGIGTKFGMALLTIHLVDGRTVSYLVRDARTVNYPIRGRSHC